MIPVGRITGHRGARGELTVRTAPPAARWLPVRRLWIGTPAAGRFYALEHSRAYRDRLVLKLAGVDEAHRAAGLRGAPVLVAREDAPPLGPDEHLDATLVGLAVEDESGQALGRVVDLVHTGATAVLVVRIPDAGEEQELQIPLARHFVLAVDEPRGRIVVRLPEELAALNRPSGRRG